jgi:hypothetical protein
VLLLDVQPALKNVLEVDCHVGFRVDADAGPIPLSNKRVTELEQLLNGRQSTANQVAQQIRAQVIGVPAGDPRRAALEAELRRAESELAVWTKRMQDMASLQSMREAAARGAAIHYRLFLLVGDCEVELVNTASGPAASSIE